MKPSRSTETGRGGRSWTARLGLAAACLLVGCSSFRTEMGRPLPTEGDPFVEGETDVATVLRQLGPPTKLSALPGGFVFLYEHTASREFQIGFSIDYQLLRYLKFISAFNHLDENAQLLVFDDDGVLRSQDTEGWRDQLGGGLAAQIVFSVISLTDDTAFRQLTTQHDWGKEDLRPLPVALNAGQSLRLGQHGLQLRLAPSYAGQHTLEMARPGKLQAQRQR